MRTKRLALGAVTGLLLVGIGAGLYALPQNTSPDPHPFMGRGMGPRGPMGRGGPMGPGGGPLGFLPMLGRELGMTEVQKDQIKNIAAGHRDEWKALGDRARSAHQALQQAVTADTVDETLIRQRSAEVAAVEADTAVARARAYAEVFQILTAEQKAKARELRTRMQDRLKERLEQRRGRGAF